MYSEPAARGFDEALVHAGGGIGNTQDYWGNDYFDDTYFRNGTPEKFQGYCTDVWFAEATKFVETNKDRPFFCYLSTNAPHGPYRVPDEYSRPYENKGVNANFYGMITNIDQNMGRLMARLRELGIEENTILIFTTDNGTATGHKGASGYNARMRGNKGSEYDGGHRVPFFVRWPGGLKGGADVSRLTAHIDVLPTLIELCGLERPAGIEFDGDSIVDLLRGRTTGWKDRVLVTDSQRIEHPQKWRKSAVMTDRWRLINGKELYDIKADPGQESDLARKNPQVVDKLRREYDKWWADISTRFGEYCRIIVGSEHENPSMLTSHDWHAHGPWNQEQIRQGQRQNSFWAIEIASEGDYEISLRRWPRQVKLPITAAPPGAKAINATTARLKVADFDQTKPIPQNAAEITFTAHLKQGSTKLQTWFTDNQGGSRGAYYVYVRWLRGFSGHATRPRHAIVRM